jgi:catechol 2,3-dioxygenase-like lactoylglutathione lyase family enzyme
MIPIRAFAGGTAMKRLSLGHIGLHVRNLEEEIAFLELVGAELTSQDTMPNGTRVAFVSLDGDHHHSVALFEDGELLPSGDSKKEKRGVHHVSMETGSRAEVDEWIEKLHAAGIETDGPYIQGEAGGGLMNGSSSYGVFFTDPNGICFEIFAEAQTVAEFRELEARRAKAKQSEPA